MRFGGRSPTDKHQPHQGGGLSPRTAAVYAAARAHKPVRAVLDMVDIILGPWLFHWYTIPRYWYFGTVLSMAFAVHAHVMFCRVGPSQTECDARV